MATVHVGNLGIYLWSNRTLFKHISLKAVQDEDYVPLISLPNSSNEQMHLDNEIEPVIIDDDDDVQLENENVEYTSPDQLSSKLVTMSTLAASRWLNLLNIDIIKNRNKSMNQKTITTPAPFFLPTVAGLQTRFDFSDVQIREDSKQLLSHPDFTSKTTFGKLLEKSIETNEFSDIIQKLKTMGPSTIDYEVKELGFDMTTAVSMTLQFMKLLKFMLKNKKDFELAQAYLSLFLKCHGAMITEEKELFNYLDDLQKYQIKSWKILKEKIFYNLSVVQQMKKT